MKFSGLSEFLVAFFPLVTVIGNAYAFPTITNPGTTTIGAQPGVVQGGQISQTLDRAIIDWSRFNNGSPENVTISNQVTHMMVPDATDPHFNDSHVSPSAGEQDTSTLSPEDSANLALHKLGLASE